MLQLIVLLALLPLVILLGVSFFMGAWSGVIKLYSFLKRQGLSGQSSFVYTLCLVTVIVALLAGPVRILGAPGYIFDLLVFVGFVALGAPKTWRLKEFLVREMNDDPNDDVKIEPKSDKKD